MTTQPTIPFCNVTLDGGALGPDTYEKARISMNGDCAVLYTWNVDDGRWRSADRLTEATFTENPNGTMTIAGLSETLLETVGVKRADASIRWIVEPLKCRNCN